MGQMNNIGPSHAPRRDDDQPCNIAIGSRAYRAERVVRVGQRHLIVAMIEMSERDARRLAKDAQGVLLSMSHGAACVYALSFDVNATGVLSLRLLCLEPVAVLRGSMLAPIETDGV